MIATRWREKRGSTVRGRVRSSSSCRLPTLVSASVVASRARSLPHNVAGKAEFARVAHGLLEEMMPWATEEITALGAQAWLTGTDDELFLGLRERARFLRVLDSNVT